MPIEPHDIGSLYRQHGAEILNYLARRCPADAAPDLLQETFLQVVRQSERLDGVTMPRAWLFGITARHVKERQRASSRFIQSSSTVGRHSGRCSKA